jgi:uncharacterized protein with beta-barrel porin domain
MSSHLGETLMKSRLRTVLLASAASALALAPHALAPHALAEDISGSRTTPILTSAANNGAGDDVNIVTGTTVTLTNGTAVTIDSNNSLVNFGTITITDADNAVGIRVLGGFTGSVTHNGTIVLNETYTRTDNDRDGTLDGPFAQGSGRTGILIEGPAAFTGDIRSAIVDIEGNQSRGISVQADLNGSLVTLGGMSLAGDNNIGVDVQRNVSGDVRLQGGSINTVGENSTAVLIAGDVGGGVSNRGPIQATGFQYPTISNYFDPDQVPANFQPIPLDADDLKAGGAALIIGGSVTEGFYNTGAVGGAAADDDEAGVDPVKDISGDFDVNRATGTITALGSAPAVLVSPDFSAASSGDLVLGLVVERIRDNTDDDDDDDLDEVIATFLEQHGFVNRGTITAQGLNIGFEGQAVVIRGSQDGTRSAIVQGGILNTNRIAASAAEADATAVRIGSGAQVARLDNSGTIDAAINTETNHNVTVLLIEANSLMTAVTNSGAMTASARGDAANIVAIRDLSGTLVSIDNTGLIASRFRPDEDDDDGDGDVADVDERTGQRIAIDLSTHQAGQNVSLTQANPAPSFDTNGDGVIDAGDVLPARIEGDVRLGAGDDSVQLLGGVVEGDIAFGAGADSLVINGGATLTGGLSDTDGQLTVDVVDGQLNLTRRDDVTVTALTLGDNSRSSFLLDMRDAAPSQARIIASDAIAIAGGAEITPVIVGIGSAQTTLVEILRAENTLSLTGGQSIADNLSLTTPFLFEAGLSTTTDGSAESVVVTIRRRTAQELGMTSNQAAAFEPMIAALNSDDELLFQVVNLSEGEEFFSVYDQLLPEYSVAALQFAVSNTDGAIGAVSTRLDAVRGGRSGAGAAWIQEFGLFLDRESSVNDPGYRGSGFGMAAGVDRPLGPFYALGLSVVGAASEIEQPKGFDTPLSVSSAQLGAYAAANAGNLLFDLYAGGGVDFFESERNIFVGSLARTTIGEWKGHHANASARLAYDMQHNRWFARPAVSVDYLRMDEESYREFGGGPGVDMAIAERTAEIFSSTASLTLGARFGSEARSWWSPRMRVGYRHENVGELQQTTAQFVAGGDPFVLTADDLPDAGGLLGFSFAAGSRYSSFALDYDADVREGFVRHGLRVAFRFIF